MGPITYSVCHKSIVGLLLTLTPLCDFPPLVSQKPVSLQAPQIILSETFYVPVDDLGYFLFIKHRFGSTEERLADRLVGAEYGVPCYSRDAKSYDQYPEDQRKRLGKPILLHATIRKVPSGELMLDKDFRSICPAGHDLKATKSQIIGLIWLNRGEYSMTVINKEARPDFANIHSSLLLSGGNAK